ncbi:MAG: hypothetical protein AVDCRST_MAG68-2073 [uncultured Gemmatimonadetes bacterium]|uniref:Uncharacterized protein n=1 Tax=uncultured Gemmatimonadota bacterium TaxID=203437 RepID=A0A6J4L5S0_9BACT|nr:MAG: hypothetical protein AVDCRST_MAG68-2073 [uncultured Gemmatimonadota bacterium]
MSDEQQPVIFDFVNKVTIQVGPTAESIKRYQEVVAAQVPAILVRSSAA